MKAFSERVERAGPDVAVNYTERSERENIKISTAWRHALDVPAGGRSMDVRGCCLCHSLLDLTSSLRKIGRQIICHRAAFIRMVQTL